MSVQNRWKFAVFVGGIIGVIGFAIYPIILDPLMNAEEVKEIGLRNKEILKARRLQQEAKKQQQASNP